MKEKKQLGVPQKSEMKHENPSFGNTLQRWHSVSGKGQPKAHFYWQRPSGISPLGAYLGNMGHIGEAVGQLLVGMDGIHSGWLGEAALRGLGRRSRWQRGRRACQGPWVVQILLWLSTAQVWGLPRLVLLQRRREILSAMYSSGSRPTTSDLISSLGNNTRLYPSLPATLPAPTIQIPKSRHLDGTGGRMLGLRLAPSRCGGRLWLVGMERRSMVWIGLVNSGCRGRRERTSAEHTRSH